MKKTIELKDHNISEPLETRAVQITKTFECVEVKTTSISELDKRILDLRGTLTNLKKQTDAVTIELTELEEQKKDVMDSINK